MGHEQRPIPEDAGGTARVIPAGGGDPIPLAAGRVGFPTWSPEGHALVCVELPNTLKLLPEPNGRATDLPAVDQAIEKLRTADTITAGDGVRLNWVPGKLIAAIDSEPTLLPLTGSP